MSTVPEVVAHDGGTGAPVVLLHGQPGEATDWDAVVGRLDGRVRTIVPDRPGYGRTDGVAVGIAANTDAVVTLLDRLGVSAAVVAAHSWAGAVALDMAQRYPDRVRALVLVASVGGDGSVDAVDRVLCWPVIGPMLSAAGLAMFRLQRVRRLVGQVVAPDVAADRLALLPSPGVRWWRSFVIEQRALVAELPDVAAQLGEVSVPATVVMGETDRLVRPRTQEALAAALPGSRLVRLAGVGHLLLQQAPGAVADEILAAADGTA